MKVLRYHISRDSRGVAENYIGRSVSGAAIWHISSATDLTSDELTNFLSEYKECITDLKIVAVDRTRHFEDSLAEQERELSTQLKQVNTIRATLGLPALVIDGTNL